MAENTLGAPTEGLGQKVTFAFQNGSGIPVQSLADIGRVRADVRGGGVGGGQTRATSLPKVQESPTMGVLSKIADQAISSRLQQAKTEAFVTGMQRAMQGEAVADIARDQPWYSKLFGDSDVIEGARAYSSQATAQTAIGAIDDKIAEVRKLGPAEAQQFFIKTVNEHLTGDAATDASVLQAFGRALPGVMRRQSKEHYGYLQERALTAETAAFNASATALQKAGSKLSTEYTTPEEFKQLRLDFLAGQTPVAGRDRANWQVGQRDRLIGLAKSGNFHALNAMIEPLEEGGPSFLEALLPDQRTAVEAAIEQGQGLLVRKYSGQWSDELARIQTQAAEPTLGESNEALAKRIDTLNAKFKTDTGSRQDFILPGERSALLSRSQTTIIREYRRQHERDEDRRAADMRSARDQAARDRIETERNLQISAAIERGTAGFLTGVPGLGPAIEAGAMNAFVAKQDKNNPGVLSADQVKMLQNNIGSDKVFDGVSTALVSQVNRAAASGEPGTEMLQALNNYTALRDSLGVGGAGSYYGRTATKMEYLYNARRNGGDGALVSAFTQAFVNGIPSRTAPSKSELAAVTAAAGNQGLWNRLFGSQPNPTDRSLGRIAADLQHAVGETAAANGGDVAGAYASVLEQRKRSGELEITGGHYMPIPGKQRTTVYRWLTENGGPVGKPIPTDNVHDLFAAAVEQAMAEKGVDDVGSVTLNRMADEPGGKPVVQAWFLKDGVSRSAEIRMDDVYPLAEKRRLFKTTKIPLQDLPKTGALAPKGALTIMEATRLSNQRK